MKSFNETADKLENELLKNFKAARITDKVNFKKFKLFIDDEEVFLLLLKTSMTGSERSKPQVRIFTEIITDDIKESANLRRFIFAYSELNKKEAKLKNIAPCDYIISLETDWDHVAGRIDIRSIYDFIESNSNYNFKKVNTTQHTSQSILQASFFKKVDGGFDELEGYLRYFDNRLVTYTNKHSVNKNNSYITSNLTDLKTIILPKSFLLLAGISGTGKTRFIREQAKATGNVSETYCLTPVRPDWHEPSDILGYISRLSGSSEYVTTEVLQFIAKAWRALIDANLDLKFDDTDGKLIVTGDISQLGDIPPYWLCLDEMNLAPVEQYFADYLSILETREWSWDGDTFDYSCDSLLSASIIKQVSKPEDLREDLGFEGAQYDEQWELFCKYGMSIPFNLIVAGTVNMDETTHGFSRKVIDRALSFDFGEFFPNDFDQFFSPTVRNKVLSYPIHSQAAIDNLLDIDIDKDKDKKGSKSIAFLNAINTVLGNTPFELAYRALNELLLAVINSQPTNEIELQAVWDDFLMCKVLPRIEGDQDKLMIIDEKVSTNNPTSLLDQLTEVLQDKLKVIWNEPKGSQFARPDLYREAEAVNDEDQVLRIACRSKAKIAWMQSRLARSSFTSFWP